ncbi:Gfo/Idh/MocA family protein [Chloroflexus aggregans]|uniref:Oxidoreductase domain protein n=1 Tax=Chloroflexus aggregans (strain MD-66 / DSM 9485) TaxID=326427 RepID=B8G9P8_CHLAD|nr:Gfo/Idh/MocA family oxidoreductase [Chloroflexus aggregans]ACL26401.1 oxidoreductase domain protein [Chloroflexus aggregans DSM 9485]
MKWGILSAGRIARRFASAVAGSATEQVVAIAARDADRAAAFAAEFGIPRAYGDYVALLNDPEVEAVYNALPNSLHAQWSIAALQAGKHVLCEKPLATTLADGLVMVAAAQAHRRLLMEAFMYRFHPQTLTVQRLLAEGVIGEVRHVRGHFAFLLDDATNIRLDPALGGGALYDIGCYPLSYARMVFGTRPHIATALMDGVAIDSSLCGMLRFGAERCAIVSCSFRTAWNQRVEIIGSEGWIHLERPFNPTPDLATTIMVARGGRHVTVETITIPPADHFRLEAEGFAALATAGAPVPSVGAMPLTESLDNLAAMEALFTSAATATHTELRMPAFAPEWPVVALS